MNLKTHSAYPEIQIAEDHSFTVKIISGKGEVKFTQSGKATSNEEARTKAKALVSSQSPKFLKKVV